MKKIQYNGSSKIINGIVTKVNLIIDKLVVDVKVNGTSVVVVNEEGEREADIDLSLADQNVKQSPTTANKDYRVLLSKSDNDTEETDIARKNTDFKYNPSTGNLQTTKLNGNTVPSGSGNDTLAKTSDIPTVATGSVFGALSFDGTDKIVKLTADAQGSGKDLNDYMTEGLYYFSSSNTPTNIPTGVNGFLLVVKYGTVIKQFWFRQGSENTQSDAFVRLHTGTAWTTWRRYATTDDLPTVNDNTISITQNGTAVDSFTLNQNSNKTIDVKDEKVKQTAISDSSNANYRLLLSKSANDTEETDGVYKNSGLYYNPYDKELTAPNASFSTAFIANLSVTNLVTSQYYFNLGSGSAVAMLEANSASTTSNPTFVTLPASSGTLALQSEIPTIPAVATGSTFGTLSFDGVDKSIKLTSDAQSSGKDLNNFKTAGIYNFSSANVPTNVPIGTNGVLIVIVFGSGVKQIWMRQGTANSNDHNMYIRMYVNSWSRWHQVFFGEMIGGVENSTTASKAYAINELMNFNGGIYRVTTAISSGGTIAASGSGANVVSTTLSAEIKAIRDALNI